MAPFLNPNSEFLLQPSTELLMDNKRMSLNGKLLYLSVEKEKEIRGYSPLTVSRNSNMAFRTN
jgi:hypothetical protein